MWHDLSNAIGLMLVIEGIGPFAGPSATRRAFLAAARLQDRQLRRLGLLSMSCGVALMYLV